jgi:hypothetical protein
MSFLGTAEMEMCEYGAFAIANIIEDIGHGA